MRVLIPLLLLGVLLAASVASARPGERRRPRPMEAGCNVYGCWTNDGGCNVYGCWHAPRGACNVYGCSDVGACNVYGCPQSRRTHRRPPAASEDAGCNVHGCWADGGGCNVYGCWNSPRGACNVYGCSNVGECNVYGCPRPRSRRR